MFKKRYANLLVYINSFDRIKEQDKVITELKSNMDVVISESFIEQQKLLDKINKMEADKQIVFKFDKEKIDFLGIDPIVRNSFLKLLE